MFDKYEEIFQIFEENFLKKIDGNNFEIRGSLHKLKSAIYGLLGVDLPTIIDGDKELILVSTKKYLDAKRDYDLAVRVYNSKNRTTFNKDDNLLIASKNDMNIKMFEYVNARSNLENTCQKYARILCIIIYDRDITLDILKELYDYGYDGSFGSNNLKLMYELYIENIDLGNRLSSLRRRNETLVKKIKDVEWDNKLLNSKIKSLNDSLVKSSNELNRLNALANGYSNNEDETQKKYLKTNNNAQLVRVFGKKPL